MVKTQNSLDCCNDKNCNLCKGTGYILPIAVLNNKEKWQKKRY